MRCWSKRAACVCLPLLFLAAPALAASAFEKLYPTDNGQLVLPHPFSALLDDMRQRSKGAVIEVGFVPLGRSLQRLAADPDFFQRPRIIAAVTRDGAQGPALRDRLFLGYQPAVGSIEIIAFDEQEQRFVFQEALDYGSGRPGRLIRHAQEDCGGCHQSGVPIFSAAPWQETNANPAVVRALAASYEGITVRTDFDGMDAFDRAVRAASRLQAAAMLWRDGCKVRACRVALLAAALKTPSASSHDTESLVATWPDGLRLVSSKLPDYDPLLLVSKGANPAAVVETEGALNPATPREPELIWRPGLNAMQDAVQLITELFGPERIAAAAAKLTTDEVEKLILEKLPTAVLDGALPDATALGQFAQMGGTP